MQVELGRRGTKAELHDYLRLCGFEYNETLSDEEGLTDGSLSYKDKDGRIIYLTKTAIGIPARIVSVKISNMLTLVRTHANPDTWIVDIKPY